MPFDAGTIASVVVGGAISGGATIYTATRVQEARERRAAEREHARALAVVRSVARVFALDLVIVSSAMGATLTRQVWWPIDLPSIPSGDDLRVLAEHLEVDDWMALVHGAATLLALKARRASAVEHEVDDDELPGMEQERVSIDRAREVLERFSGLRLPA